jgi:hypothetical protein
VFAALITQQFSRDMLGVIVGAEGFSVQPAFHVPNADHAARDCPSSFHDRSASLFRGRLDCYPKPPRARSPEETQTSDPTTEIVAKKIIELAQRGERDPVRLRERAIRSLSE